MKKSIALALVLALILPALSGCFSAVEIGQRAFVLVLTLDAVEDGRLRVGVQIASGAENLNESNAPVSGGQSSVGSGQGGEGDGGGGAPGDGHNPADPSNLQQGAYYLISAVGQDYPQALALLYATIPRKLDFSHVRELLISEDLARSDAFPQILEALMVTPSMRMAAYLVVAQGSALDLAAHQQSFLGSRLAEYLELRMRNASYYGFIAQATLAEVWKNMAGNRADTAVTYASVNDFSATKALTGGRPLDELPGRLPRLSINETEYLGAALIDGQRMVGVVTGFGIEMTHLLRGCARLLFYSADGEAFRLRQRRAPRHTVTRTGDRWTLRFDIWLEVRQSGLQRTMSIDRLIAALREDCAAQVRFYQALRCDPIGFGEQAVRAFPTLSAWEAFDWRQAFHDADIDIRVHLTENDTI